MPLSARHLVGLGAAVAAVLLVISLMVTGLAPTSAVQRVQLLKDPAEVTAIDPTTGSLAGGDVVTITGQGLTTVTGVTFGGQPATEVTVIGATSVTAVVPPSVEWASGVGSEVEVLGATGAVAAASTLTYTYTAVTAVDRQLEYAFQHWNNYNLAAFGDFNVWGGDCMNFVSQTLMARGWAPTADWFNSAQQEWAPAFVHVPSFDEWLASHPEYGAVRLTLAERDQAKFGDVVVIDWDGDGSLDHAQVISGLDGGRIHMVGHNLDTMYRDLDSALLVQGTPAAVVYIWSIPLA